MSSGNLIDRIKQALPGLLRDDPELRQWVL
jgi:hypothetical protein